MQVFLKLYSDDTLPDNGLLAHLDIRDPALQNQLKEIGADQTDASATIVIEDPNDTDGERYLSNTGRSRAPYDWPINLFTRYDQWFFVVPNELDQLADASTYKAELTVQRGGNKLTYACFIAFVESPEPYEAPQSVIDEQPAPRPPRASPRAPRLLAIVSLLVAASSALTFYYQDNIRAMMAGRDDTYHRLKWTYDTSHPQFNVAQAIGRAAKDCSAVNVKIKPVFGSVRQQGIVLDYVRHGRSAITDVLSFQLDCGNRNILGQIELTFNSKDMPPLAETTIQMSPDRFIPVKISDLPVPDPENWHWYEISANDGIASKKIGMQGLMITMLSNEKKQMKFKIQNLDKNIANGILTILPPSEQ